MNMTKELSSRFANMGLFCALLVVFIHTPFSASDATVKTVFSYFSHGIGKIAVPFFFAAAGYFLAGHFEEDGWYRREVLKRFRSLLVPLVLWCVINYLLWSVAYAVAGNLAHHRAITENLSLPSPVGMLQILALYPFDQPGLRVLWFVRTLFCLVVFSPVLKKLANPLGVLILWLAHGLVYPDYGAKLTPLLFTLHEGCFSLFGAAYFCAGACLRRRNANIMSNYKVGSVCLLIGVALLLLRGAPYEMWIDRILTWLYTPFVMAGVWCLMPTKPLPAILKGAAFPVYVLHMFVIVAIGCAVDVKTLPVAGYIGLGLAAFVVSILLAAFMRKFLPACAGVLFGGR